MNNLLYKELRLAMHPTVFIFLSFGILLLIPSWPYFIAFGYLFLAVLLTFMNDRTNHDTFFTASLPVPKRDVVHARVFAMAAAEVLQIIAAVPFAYLNTLISPHGNLAGMNPNIAFFGFVFVMYAVFNAVFFPMFYKTAHKVGIPILAGMLASVLFVGAVESLVNTVQFLRANVNTVGADHLGSQLIVLFAGILLFFLALRFAYRRAAGNFEKTDL